MPKQSETRNYSMADADLKQEADDLKDSVIRDIVQFNTRNITQTNVEEFEGLINQFDETSTDDELLGVSGDAVLKKNALAEQIKVAIRPIRNMADLAYKGVGKYKVFGFTDMAHLSDNDLYRMAKRVVRVGNSLISDLAPQGLSTNQLALLNNKSVEFDLSIDAVGQANENRDLEAQDRMQKGNLLWAKMTTLASIGQSLFADTDAARFNDYVLVGSSSPTVDVVPVVPPTN